MVIFGWPKIWIFIMFGSEVDRSSQPILEITFGPSKTVPLKKSHFDHTRKIPISRISSFELQFTSFSPLAPLICPILLDNLSVPLTLRVEKPQNMALKIFELDRSLEGCQGVDEQQTADTSRNWIKLGDRNGCRMTMELMIHYLCIIDVCRL